MCEVHYFIGLEGQIAQIEEIWQIAKKKYRPNQQFRLPFSSIPTFAYAIKIGIKEEAQNKRNKKSFFGKK
jgi:hypothetical protein